MHKSFEEEDVVHRERLSDALSLDRALLSNPIAHFNSSVSVQNFSTWGGGRILLKTMSQTNLNKVAMTLITLGYCSHTK